MFSNGCIEVTSLSKQYRRGELSYHTLRDDVTDWVLRRQNSKHSYMWALEEINLSVKKGEAVAVIGDNGSGKTTLLRCISRVTHPTKGDVKTKGRMGVLIELMAGFHPELTGNQNILFNGVVMGMSHKEVKAQLPEILEYAELKEWADTPLKRYSSGMNIRLGFAVACCTNPEILLTDEVLAICDVSFQRKAVARMAELSRKGTTLLFVSHNLTLAEQVCTRGVWLQHGRVVYDGSIDEAVRRYKAESGSSYLIPCSAGGYPLDVVATDPLQEWLEYYFERRRDLADGLSEVWPPKDWS